MSQLGDSGADGASRAAAGNLVTLTLSGQWPANVEAEQALLGAILVNNEAAHRVTDILRPEHFFQPAHAKIFESALTFIGKGQKATPLVLKPYFDNEPALTEVGGSTYLSRLAQSAVSLAAVEDYARAIADAHVRRGIIAACQTAAAKAHNPRIDETGPAQIDALAAELDGLKDAAPRKSLGWVDHAAMLEAAAITAERASKQGLGVQTGLADLDRALGGLEPGSITIIAGRPSMGKSAIAQAICRNASAAGVPTGFVSLEMSHDQIGMREMAACLGIPLERVRRGELSPQQWEKARAIQNASFHVDASGGLTVAQIKDRARTLQRKHGLGLLVIDYLQLIRPDHTYRGQKVAEVAEISAGLKALAVELQIPVVVLSQLSREVEHRDDKRPRLSDLRWSGDVEQDADNVLLLYRHRYYHRDDDGTAEWEASNNVLEVIIAKQRQGCTGTIEVFYEPATSRFGNLSR